MVVTQLGQSGPSVRPHVKAKPEPVLAQTPHLVTHLHILVNHVVDQQLNHEIVERLNALVSLKEIKRN